MIKKGPYFLIDIIKISIDICIVIEFHFCSYINYDARKDQIKKIRTLTINFFNMKFEMKNLNIPIRKQLQKKKKKYTNI